MSFGTLGFEGMLDRLSEISLTPATSGRANDHLANSAPPTGKAPSAQYTENGIRLGRSVGPDLDVQRHSRRQILGLLQVQPTAGQLLWRVGASGPPLRSDLRLWVGGRERRREALAGARILESPRVEPSRVATACDLERRLPMRATVANNARGASMRPSSYAD